jgi:hypothetical protein
MAPRYTLAALQQQARQLARSLEGSPRPPVATCLAVEWMGEAVAFAEAAADREALALRRLAHLAGPHAWLTEDFAIHHDAPAWRRRLANCLMRVAAQLGLWIVTAGRRR